VNVPQKTRKTKDTTRLPIVKCSCGAEILLIPDVKKMNQAIEAHVLEHTKNIKNTKEAEAEAERVRSELIIKVLDLASEM
jgi:hypothetical protein